jgi:hypothetical protein
LAKVGRSLPNLVRSPWHDFRAITKFLSLRDGADEAPRLLLTGGLLVRIQPEVQSFHLVNVLQSSHILDFGQVPRIVT